MTDSEEERALRKRERLASIAAVLRSSINPNDDIEAIVVVVSTSDGEFVGVASNVATPRADAILKAAAFNGGHVDHPQLREVVDVNPVMLPHFTEQLVVTEAASRAASRVFSECLDGSALPLALQRQLAIAIQNHGVITIANELNVSTGTLSLLVSRSPLKDIDLVRKVAAAIESYLKSERCPLGCPIHDERHI